LMFTLIAYLTVAQYVKERFIHKFGSLLWFSGTLKFNKFLREIGY
jgi:hypothetical protein